MDTVDLLAAFTAWLEESPKVWLPQKMFAEVSLFHAEIL